MSLPFCIVGFIASRPFASLYACPASVMTFNKIFYIGCISGFFEDYTLPKGALPIMTVKFKRPTPLTRKEELFMCIFKSLRKKRPTATDILKAEINMTKAELETAYSHFENVVDPDLISSSIYHINSIQERYKYLMKMVKALEAEQKQKQNAAP